MPSTWTSSTDGRRVALAAVEPEPGDGALGRLAALAQMRDPVAAAVGAVDAGDEARDHLPELARAAARRSARASGSGEAASRSSSCS